MSRNSISRREFVGIGSAVAGASLAARPVWAAGRELLEQERSGQQLATVRFGIIGVGMQGSVLLRESIGLTGVECGGACDLYDGRHVLAREIAGADLPVTRRYQQLLDDPSITSIIAAVPDHWHKKIVIDAVNAGKDVYCEKPMSHSAADGVAMVDAVQKTDRIVQIGSQRVSSRICAKAREMIAEGMLGELTMAEACLGRNDPSGAWQYPPPPDLSPSNLDWETWQGDVRPKRAFDPILFARWRCWKEYGTGLAGDLLVHLISGMMYMLDINAPPTSASAVAAIRRWNDGRNMPDVHTVVYDYEGLPISMRLNLGTHVPEAYRIHGSRGLLEVAGPTITFTPQSGVDTSPSYYSNSFPRELREAYVKKWREENEARLTQQPLAETVSFSGPHYDSLRLHLQVFFDAVRSRRPVVEDAVFGHHAALACHMANEAHFRGKTVTWDAASKSIKS